MSSTRGHFEGLSEKPDRRAYTRSNPLWLTYVELGDENGGIAVNISEGGLAVTAAGIVLSDYFPRIRFQLAESTGWIETSGQVAWTSDSKKGAGIHFDGLTDVDREKIRNWILSKDAASNESWTASRRVGKERQQSLIRSAGKGEKVARKLEVLSEEDEARFAAMFPSEGSLPRARDYNGAKIEAEPEEAEQTERGSRDTGEFAQPRGTAEEFGAETALEPSIEGNISPPERNSPADTCPADSADRKEEKVGEPELTDVEASDSLFGYEIHSAEDTKLENFRPEDLLLAANARQSLEAEERTPGQWALPTITHPQETDWRQQFDWNRGREAVGFLSQQTVAVSPERKITLGMAGLGILTAAICFLLGLAVGKGALNKLLRHDGAGVVSRSEAETPAQTNNDNTKNEAERIAPQPSQALPNGSPDASLGNSSGLLNGATPQSGTDVAVSPAESGRAGSRESGEGEDLPPGKDLGTGAGPEAAAAPAPSDNGLSNVSRGKPDSKRQTTTNQPDATSAPPESKPQPRMDTGASAAAPSETAQTEKPFSEVQGPILVTPPDEKSGPFRLMLAEEAVSASPTLAISAQSSVLIPARPGPASTHRPERLQAGVLIYHVDPEAPTEANTNSGTVKVRATIGKGGDVVDVQAISGHMSLVSRVVRAVREWRYTVTLLDGQPLGAEEDVVVEFRPRR